MRIQSPEGRVGSRAIRLASTPEVLQARRLAILDNGKPGAALVMQAVASRLAERAQVELVGVHRKRTAATPCEDALLDEIAQEADFVLTGTAD